MQFIYQYPEANGTDTDLLDAGPVVDVAVALEKAGWNGFAFTEHPVPGHRWLEAGGHQTLDPFIALSHAAAVTANLRLLTYLAVVPYRNPFLLAKSAASVDKLSGGRFILGVGTGYLKGEFRALGVDFDERNELFDEALEVLPMHWRGEPFSYDGKHFSAKDVIARPRPVQNPIPIWIGGNAKLTLRRVATKAQGWMPLLGPAELASTTRSPHLETIEEVGATIAELRELAGDRADSLDIAFPYLDGTILDLDKDVERHRDALGRLKEIGATWVTVALPSPSAAATFEFVEGFGASYIAP